MDIDAAHCGVLLLDDLIDIAGAARNAQFQFDSGISFLETALEFFA